MSAMLQTVQLQEKERGAGDWQLYQSPSEVLKAVAQRKPPGPPGPPRGPLPGPAGPPSARSGNTQSCIAVTYSAFIPMLVPDVECLKRDKMHSTADLRARTCQIQDSDSQLQQDVRIESYAH